MDSPRPASSSPLPRSVRPPTPGVAAGVTALLLLLSAAAAAPLPAATLVINSNQSDPEPRKAVDKVVDMFKKENPDVDVRVNVYDHESYKISIRNWLTSAPPDVVFWFSGIRMKRFVDLGLLADVSAVFTPEVKQQFGSSADSVAFKGKEYGVPFTYYQWGIFYRKDLFAQAGINEPPKTWPEFLDACAKLKAANLIPITIGTKDFWPAAGWFDYLDLRLNGLDFHRRLLSGEIPFTDGRVREVFSKWEELLKPGYFVSTHASSTWQDGATYLYQGKAAMYLMGNFITQSFPSDLQDKLGFFAFPEIKPGTPRFEEAPTDCVNIPARAKNKADATKFLAFFAKPEVQSAINEIDKCIPCNHGATVAADPFLQAGTEVLKASAGQSQFFDRDTDEEFAKVSMRLFQEFMLHPERLDNILKEIDRARGQILTKKPSA